MLIFSVFCGTVREVLRIAVKKGGWTVKAGFIIPVYNHGSTLEAVVDSLRIYSLPVIVVDDGNDARNRHFIDMVASSHPEVELVTLEKNRGKGAAMNRGLVRAGELGWTHAFQLDADGQHDAGACGDFLKEAEKNPLAVICGYPVYDETVPEMRRNGREFSNRWARLVTWNKDIKDVLCGFRIYPVDSYLKVLRKHAWIHRRMGYDVDILVHLLWDRVPLVNMGVRVTYPADGVSNFRMVRDNLGISSTFARLFIGMILRIPVLIIRRLGEKN